MAITFNPAALDAFRNAQLTGENAIANLQHGSEGTGGIRQATTTYANTLTVGKGETPMDAFGTFTVQTKLVLDLSAEVPTVVDARFAQTLD